MPMTEEEILDYRSNQFPGEIIDKMSEVKVLAGWADTAKDGSRAKALENYLAGVRELRTRAQYYYDKRKKDFGIEHMRLRRLVRSCDEMLKGDF